MTGRVYHQIFDVRDQSHSLHWFLYDDLERLSKAKDLSVTQHWVGAVKDGLDCCNPYIRELRRFNSVPQGVCSALELRDFSAAGELGAILHVANTTSVNPRNIMIWNNRNERPSFIPLFSKHYEPLQYPLLFPHGTPGWGLNTQDDEDSDWEATQRQYYRYRLLTKEHFSAFGRLASEYACDMYSRLEESRLEFIRRSSTSAEAEQMSSAPLPASFIGSRRWASEQTADSLALARAYGKPTFFITMTFNPQWPEVKQCLRRGQSISDQPLLMNRIFVLRMQRLLKILRTKFGELLYLIWVKEFQIRGFPHLHLLMRVSFNPFVIERG